MLIGRRSSSSCRESATTGIHGTDGSTLPSTRHRISLNGRQHPRFGAAPIGPDLGLSLCCSLAWEMAKIQFGNQRSIVQCDANNHQPWSARRHAGQWALALMADNVGQLLNNNRLP